MQKIIVGIDLLNDVLQKENCKKVLIVAGKSFSKLPIKNEIDKIPIQTDIFSGFTPNPLYEQIVDGFEQFNKGNFDTLLAIGGGSAIDVAKCIKYAALATNGLSGLLSTKDTTINNGRNIQLVAIPTTAGSGSESTHNAVMYYDGIKQTVTSDAIMPNYAFLESSVLEKLPVYIKKCTLLDALCQAIESWWSVNSTEESKEYSRTAIDLIMSNWDAYIFDNQKEAAKNIMMAANYSGRAINIAQTTAAHAMSYKITSIYGLPHGHAVSICLPELWDYMVSDKIEVTDKRGKEYVLDVLNEIKGRLNIDFRDLLAKMAIKNPISQNKSLDIEILSNSVNPIRLKNNPVKISTDTAKILYNKIIK